MEVTLQGEGIGGQGLALRDSGGRLQQCRNLTSAARPILADLKAVSAEAEGAVPCHDAAVAAPQLVAG